MVAGNHVFIGLGKWPKILYQGAEDWNFLDFITKVDSKSPGNKIFRRANSRRCSELAAPNLNAVASSDLIK
jgi:hypothetical protein